MSEVDTKTAKLAVKTALAVAELMRRVQGGDDHVGPMGGIVQVPTTNQRAQELESEANQLDQLLESPLHRSVDPNSSEGR
jgi:hypothetical protein